MLPLRHGGGVCASHLLARAQPTRRRPREFTATLPRHRRTKYVCTSNPEELAWHLGLNEKDLVTGVKPEDLELIECAEEWSHTGTPQWACIAKEKATADKDTA